MDKGVNGDVSWLSGPGHILKPSLHKARGIKIKIVAKTHLVDVIIQTASRRQYNIWQITFLSKCASIQNDTR